MTGKVEVVEIKVPFAEEFGDYHDIQDLADGINQLAHAHPALKSVEVARCGNHYIGVFYVGRQPSRKRLKEIVKESLGVDDKEHEICWDWDDE
jgi:hypothetical protein